MSIVASNQALLSGFCLAALEEKKIRNGEPGFEAMNIVHSYICETSLCIPANELQSSCHAVNSDTCCHHTQLQLDIHEQSTNHISLKNRPRCYAHCAGQVSAHARCQYTEKLVFLSTYICIYIEILPLTYYVYLLNSHFTKVAWRL